MIDVGAVGISRSWRDFQILWARSWRPQDVSVHIVFAFAKNVNRIIDGVDEAPRKGGYLSSHPPRENRSWGILSDFFSCTDPAIVIITALARSSVPIALAAQRQLD